MSPVSDVKRLWGVLPKGGTLDTESWEKRHRALLIILWAHVPILIAFALAAGEALFHSILEASIVALLALFGSAPALARRARAAFVTVGLVTCSALLVHFSGGVIEFHFHFFVVVALITLYQDWTPFLLAIGYVLVHHGVFGALWPQHVFNHAPAQAHPWRWAALHALFIACESMALLAAWRFSENQQDETLRSVRRLHQAQHIARVGSWTWIPATDRIHVSEDLAQLYGEEDLKAGTISLAEWIGDRPEDEKGKIRETLARVLESDEPLSFETEGRGTDGRPRFFSTVAETAKDPGRGELIVIGATREITEERKLHAQLSQAQKMDAVGQLAGGIAHDFNNLLAVVINYARFLVEELPEDSSLRADAQEIVKAGDRGAALTRQLLMFSRKEVMSPKVLSLNEIVIDLEKMLKRTLRESIRLQTHLAAEISLVKVDPGQIEQVLLNLAVNARDAMPDGGTLSLETRQIFVDTDMLDQHPGLKPGAYVCLTVSDSGVGMPKEVKARIFEPFFTTKEKGKGTGLGLASVYGIMKQNEGYISVYSEPGLGTTFRLYFPPTHESVQDQVRAPEVTRVRGNGELVLVVEDEDAVRELVARVLTKNGYEVVTAPAGKEALALVANEQRSFSLLLTDVILPTMSGRDISERLGLPTVFMSGYTHEIIAEHAILADGERLIQKPFDPETLLRTVREAIEGAQGAAVPRVSADKRDLSATDLHVLVIEDDPGLRDLLSLVLGMDDVIGEVSAVSSAPEALALCRTNPPDVVVTDSMGREGQETPGQQIRATLPAVPIISFSGREGDRPWANLHISKSGKGLDRIVEAVREIALSRV